MGMQFNRRRSSIGRDRCVGGSQGPGSCVGARGVQRMKAQQQRHRKRHVCEGPCWAWVGARRVWRR